MLAKIKVLQNATCLLLIIALLSACSKKGNITDPVGQDSANNNQTPDTVNNSRTDTAANATAYWGNGVNLQPSYYNNGNVTFGWDLMKQNEKIKTLRIEIEPGINIDLARSWIRQAIDNGFNVIATYHKASVLGSDDAGELTAAANWWKANYDTLRAAGNFKINLMNEWGSHQITANVYAINYNNAISIVRQVYDGPIIIDCPGWGQETTIAADAVKGTDGVAISDTNIVLSVHIYPGGWNEAKHRASQAADLDELASAGRPCLVGEFGKSATGNADWKAMVLHAKELHWAILGWCWNGDGNGMNMVSPAWNSNAAASVYTKSDYFDIIYNLL